MNIVADNGYVTEILEPGPHISEAHLKEFGASFIRLAEESSLIIPSGSAAPGISADIYARLIRSAAAMGKKSDSGYQRRAAEGRDSGCSRCCGSPTVRSWNTLSEDGCRIGRM